MLVVVALALVLLWWLRRRKLRAAGETKEGAERLQRVSYQQLRRATGGFAAGRKLGQGGFGPVFRGALPPPRGGGGGVGRPVAVKVSHLLASGSASHLLASGSASASSPDPDAAAKSGEKARDSILLPFAYSMSARGEGRARRMMLVYELMPNGSLQDALLGRRCPELVAEWSRRLSVARDVAAALHYLHSVVKPPVAQQRPGQHGPPRPPRRLRPRPRQFRPRPRRQAGERSNCGRKRCEWECRWGM